MRERDPFNLKESRKKSERRAIELAVHEFMESLPVRAERPFGSLYTIKGLQGDEAERFRREVMAFLEDKNYSSFAVEYNGGNVSQIFRSKRKTIMYVYTYRELKKEVTFGRASDATVSTWDLK